MMWINGTAVGHFTQRVLDTAMQWTVNASSSVEAVLVSGRWQYRYNLADGTSVICWTDGEYMYTLEMSARYYDVVDTMVEYTH